MEIAKCEVQMCRAGTVQGTNSQWAVQRGEGGVSKHGYVIATKPFLNDGGVIGH